MAVVHVLDGPMGTELARRGVPLQAPLWSAAALDSAAALVAQIHADYAAAGAELHTAATFRTQRRAAGARWRELTAQAVHLARSGVPSGCRVAGSIAPLEDCYRPDLSPPDPGPEHAELAEALVACGCDLLLCETFPHVGEALAATSAAAGRGVPVWTALTAGYRGELLSPVLMARAAVEAVERGASAVLVNCVPATQTLPFVDALAGAVGHRVPVGAYANAGTIEEGLGWGQGDPEAYVALAQSWVQAGATLIGGCCGTSPATIAALRATWPALHTSTSVRSTGERDDS